MAARSRSQRQRRPWYSAPRSFLRHWPTVLIVVGLALVLYNGVNNYYYNRALQPSVAAPVVAKTAKPSQPVRLTVAGVVDKPLEPQQYKNGQWTVSKLNGSYMNGSARPGEKGNTIIYGHNTNNVFGPLLHLKGTERIVLTTKDGRKHRYRIVSLKQVTTDQVDVLAPTKTEVLTIYTCSGWLDSKRFVIRATPVG